VPTPEVPSNLPTDLAPLGLPPTFTFLRQLAGQLRNHSLSSLESGNLERLRQPGIPDRKRLQLQL